ncbi:MAG: AbrB/MazE/SpoVT family DNA-binding domain-containing protein [Betaproteobacteria bacterium]|nr:AbrB/MazE/SpoVT family DNA-binding domain-containing protein [Betaproteobacteria bacterium]
MKTTLIVSSRGVVTLPAKLRAALGIQADDHVIAEATPDGILLRPAVTLPIEMYSAARVAEFDATEAELATAMDAAKRRTPTAKAPRKPARARR